MTATVPQAEQDDRESAAGVYGTAAVEILSAARAVAPLRAVLETTPADDILVCTYTANLGFFSRAAAGRSRSRGARVSVVSDPAQTNYDPELVRGAGSEWLDGRAWCDGAFHPKLIVVASNSHATVCIGSGNATPAGWVSNAELWVRFDAEQAAAPAAVAGVGLWLQGLLHANDEGRLHLGPGVTEVVGAAAKRLASYSPVGPSAEVARVVSNLDEPIIESLPHGPVDELIVASPFLDEAAEALARVCARLEPAKLTVMIGDDFRYDGAALQVVVARHAGQVIRIADDRPHHGKLLEWSAGHRRQALIGSPNVTRAALCRTLGEADANCELAVICDLPDSLAPTAGAAVGAGELATHRYHKPTSLSAPMLVGAMVDLDGTTLTLARPYPSELDVEAYDDDTMTWVPVRYESAEGPVDVVIPPRVIVHTAAGWRPVPGRPLRVRAVSGPPSAPYPATDPGRLTPRRASRSDLAGHSDAFPDDPAFLGQLRDALMRLAADWRRQPPVPAGHGGHRPGAGPSSPQARGEPEWQPVPPGDDRSASWQTRPIEQLRSECGEAFSEFVLPQLSYPSGPWRPQSPIPGEPPGEDDDPDDPDQPLGDDRSVRRRARRKRDLRNWVFHTLDPVEQSPEWKQLRKASNGTCTLADVCIAAVVLSAWALDAFGSAKELVLSLERALRPLAWPADSPDLIPPAASAAAVGVWILETLAQADETSGHHTGIIRPRLRRLAVVLSDRLSDLDEPGLEARCAGLATIERDGRGPDPFDVLGVALRAASPDRIAELASALPGDASTDGRVVTLAATLTGDGVVAILGRWAALEAAGPVAVQADAAAGRVFVAWAAPHLLIARQRPRRRATLYRLNTGLSAVAATENRRPPGSTEIANWFDDTSPPEAGVAVLAACEASLAWTAG